MVDWKKDIESLRKDIERLQRYKLEKEDYRQKLYTFKKSLRYWEKRFDEEDMDRVRSFYHEMQEIATDLPYIEKSVYNKTGKILSKQAQHKAERMWRIIYELYHISLQIKGDEVAKKDKNQKLMLIALALVLVFFFLILNTNLTGNFIYQVDVNYILDIAIIAGAFIILLISFRFKNLRKK